MPFSNEILIQIAIAMLGLCGFLVARHIRKHKTKNTPLVCPVGFDCHAVVHSDYSKFLGIPVEVAGIIYYTFVFISYLVFVITPWLLSPILIGSLIVMSYSAFLFSVYLILVQIFILRKGCSWCIVSALISASIFLLTLFSYDFASVAQNILK